MDFVVSSLELLNKRMIAPTKYRNLTGFEDIYDDITNLIYRVILKSTVVNTEEFVSWEIQHNAIWRKLARYNNERAFSIIRRRLTRRIHDEIKEMNDWPNLKGAHIVAYVLNVISLNPIDRRNGRERKFYLIQKIVHDWIRTNYARLLTEHPKVAQACLVGRLFYDAENHRIGKTYRNELSNTPKRAYLDLQRA